MNIYRVRPGFRHGAQKQYGPGDTVELTAAQAAAFDDKLEYVGPAVAPSASSAGEDAPEIETGEDAPAPKAASRAKKAA